MKDFIIIISDEQRKLLTFILTKLQLELSHELMEFEKNDLIALFIKWGGSCVLENDEGINVMMEEDILAKPLETILEIQDLKTAIKGFPPCKQNKPSSN